MVIIATCSLGKRVISFTLPLEMEPTLDMYLECKTQAVFAEACDGVQAMGNTRRTWHAKYDISQAKHDISYHGRWTTCQPGGAVCSPLSPWRRRVLLLPGQLQQRRPPHWGAAGCHSSSCG
ncbi:hypothetical protein N2152v2_009921 [Parachlorella kessleri]